MKRVYTWTERVGSEQRERLLSTMTDPNSLSIVAELEGGRKTSSAICRSAPPATSRNRATCGTWRFSSWTATVAEASAGRS